MDYKPFEEYLFTCQCFSLEHQFVFVFDPEEKECYLSPHLITYKGFWARLWHGLKYVFGHRSRYGAWDSVIIHQSDAIKLKELLGQFIEGCKEK